MLEQSAQNYCPRQTAFEKRAERCGKLRKGERTDKTVACIKERKSRARKRVSLSRGEALACWHLSCGAGCPAGCSTARAAGKPASPMALPVFRVPGSRARLFRHRAQGCHKPGQLAFVLEGSEVVDGKDVDTRRI